MNSKKEWQLLAFDQSVYVDRLDQLRLSLVKRSLTGVLIFDPENIYWLTGYQTIGYFTFQSLFVGADNRVVIIGRVVNRDLALAHETIDEFVAVHDTDDHVAVLASWLNSHVKPDQKLGLETSAWNFKVEDYLGLIQQLACSADSCNQLVEPMRMVKSDAEINKLKAAARCAEAGLDAAIEVIAPGKSENDVAAAMFDACISSGSEYLGHPPLVVTGETTALCFAMWRRRQIRQGDVVLLESAGCVDRYHSMLSRPVVVGAPTREQRQAADALQQVLEVAIETIRPGLTSGEVDRSCRDILSSRGLDRYFRHRLAYGIGIGFPPNWSEGHIYAIRPDDPLVLEPNMTFHVIPTLFLDTFGMCFSDSVRVTESGCELLTHFERRLFVV